MNIKKPDPKVENSINTNTESDKKQISDFLLFELASMQQRIKEICELNCISLDIGSRDIRLDKESFLASFDDFETVEVYDHPGLYILRVYLKGTEFYCFARR